MISTGSCEKLTQVKNIQIKIWLGLLSEIGKVNLLLLPLLLRFRFTLSSSSCCIACHSSLGSLLPPPPRRCALQRQFNNFKINALLPEKNRNINAIALIFALLQNYNLTVESISVVSPDSSIYVWMLRLVSQASASA